MRAWIGLLSRRQCLSRAALGRLPDGWAGNFALHACALGLEIVSGEAICVDSARWAATFVVRTADPRARMARHDFLTWRGALRASYRRCPSRMSRSLCRKHTAGAP